MKKRIIAITTAAVAMSGCSIIQAEKDRDRANAEHEQAVDRFLQTRSKASESVIVHGDNAYYINKKATLIPEQTLPATFVAPMSMQVEDGATPASLLRRVGAATGVSFFAVDGAPAGIKSDTSTKVFAAGQSYEGTPAELLDRIASATDCYWRVKGGRVEFFKYETRVYKIASTSGKKVVSTATDGKIGTSIDSFKNDLELDAFADAEESVKRMITTSGTVYRSNSTRALTVTDEPRVHRRIAEYIEQLNADLTKQVKIEVDIYTVDVNNQNGASVSIDAVLKGTNFTRTLTAAGTDAAGIFNMAVTNTANKWVGSEAVVSALQKFGTVSVKNAISQTVMNGSVLPISNTRNITYFSKISTVITQGVSGSQKSVETATASEGFSATLRANVVAGDSIIVNGTINTSTVKLKPETIDGTVLQNADTNANATPIEINLKSGQSQLFGYKYQSLNSDASGMAGVVPYLPIGGSNTATTSEKMVVIRVSAKLIDSAVQY